MPYRSVEGGIGLLMREQTDEFQMLHNVTGADMRSARHGRLAMLFKEVSLDVSSRGRGRMSWSSF
jgi:hypothetical protein